MSTNSSSDTSSQRQDADPSAASGSSSGSKAANGDAERRNGEDSERASKRHSIATTPASPSLTISTFDDDEKRSGGSSNDLASSSSQLRQPAPIRPGDTLSPSASPSYAPHKHHHQRSRSVNLSPVMRVGSFVPPPSSPKNAPGGVNLNLAWENNFASGSGGGASTGSSSNAGSSKSPSAAFIANGMDPRHRSASPLNLGGPLKVPATRPASSGGDANHSFPPHIERQLHSRSPELSTRRGAHGSSSSAHRNASPARLYAMPVSPRLKAFGSDRMRRSSSSSSSGSSGSDKGAHHTGSSPPNRPASPVPGPINPDPEHAFDSIWPSDAAVASTSPSSPQRHRGELLHNWMMDRRRSESRSPSHADAQRASLARSAFSSSPGSAGSGSASSPIIIKGGGPFGHRKSLSASSSNSSASPTISISMLEPSRGGSPAPSSTPPPGSAGLHRSASNPGLQIVSPPPARGSPVSRFISPTTSSVKVDAQSVLAEVTPSGESPPASPKSPTSSSRYLSSGSEGQVQRRNSLNTARRRSLALGDGSPTSPSTLGSPSFPPRSGSTSPFANRSGASLARSPTPTAPGTSESPPKTRSFIGMPPRSGYELSDDPDDVGSEDGTSSSVSSGGQDDSKSQTTDDDDEERRRVREEDDDDEEDADEREERETGAFEADEEDALANERRTENARQLRDQSPSPTPAGEETESSSTPMRPALPKRPSLTRSSAVPSMPPSAPSQPAPSSFNPLRHFDVGAGASDPSMWHDPATNADNAPPADGNDSLLEGITIPPPDPADNHPSSESQPIASAVLAAMEDDDQIGHDEEHDLESGGAGEEGEGEDSHSQDTSGGEESLSTLERIFLFAKSEMTYHRIIVSRSLPHWIREVELSEAVEYVIALLNGLATDDADVCTAFAGELDQIMWFFFLNCPLAENDSEEGEDGEGDAGDESKATRPRLPVGVFTPLICALLLNQNATVAQTAQTSLVQFFQRLNRGEEDEQDRDGLVLHAAGREGELVDYEAYKLDAKAKQIVANELLEHVAFSMGRHSQQGQNHEEHSGNDLGEVEKAQENGVSGDKAVDEPLGQAQPSESDEDSSWDAEMREDGDIDIGGLAADDWRKISSPFGSSSPIFDAYDRADIDEEAAVGRMAAVSLIGALSLEAGAVSPSTVSDRFLPEILSLRDDAAFYVRKEVAMALGALSKHLDAEQVQERVLPAFEQLCADKIWHVRQAATTSLPAIFGRVKGQVKRETVVKLMRAFAGDVSRNVRTTALEIIGEAIYLFHEDEGGVPQELVRFFLGEPFDEEQESSSAGEGLSNDKQDGSEGSFLFADFDFGSAMNGGANKRSTMLAASGSESGVPPTPLWERPDYNAGFDDADRRLVMAYNFPAVVLTLGGDAAWPRLRQAHARLISSDSPKVRQSLSASLHEIAKLVSTETVRDELLPTFERLLSTNDEESDVKAALLENANVLLSRAPKDAALRQLGLLRDLWSTSFANDWRLREALALQVPLLADSFVGDDDEGCLMSIMQAALCDAISSVRDAGVKAVPALYRNFVLQHDQTIADGVLGMLSDMGEAKSYRVRVGFLRAVEALVREEGGEAENEQSKEGHGRLNAASFRLVVLPRLMELASDLVIDVRLALSSLVTTICHRHQQSDKSTEDGEGGFSRSSRMIDLLRHLSRDWSSEVRDPVLAVLAVMFGQEDPICQLEEGQAHERRARRRSELVLGPADGGPHRPPPSENGDYQNNGGTLTTMMDFDQDGEDEDDEGQQGIGEPFQMDEDDQPYNSLHQRQRRNRHRSHQMNGHRGYDDDEEDDDEGMEDMLDSDLEMVNLDDAAEANGDADATMTDDKQGANVLGLENHPSTASADESFESFTSSDSGDAGNTGEIMYLTSPERPCDVWSGQQSFFSASHDDAPPQGKEEPPAKGEAGEEQDDGGSEEGSDDEGQAEAKTSSADPFLSFVSFNLGAAGKKSRRRKKKQAPEATSPDAEAGS
ncbi:ARM repeat-containing protein [Jaminaea rosea]|uniref:ARM repeat-containing protein n=1 Tax=Jaminaea rosea TaxID=1569628 RepID=A0A316UTZ1_9BASI|nr:ARM repeat-containing protein [Jaminaea rosea]PWN28268.1 ARM repeat-containing protein [Jaminaea rosea]